MSERQEEGKPFEGEEFGDLPGGDPRESDSLGGGKDVGDNALDQILGEPVPKEGE